MKRFVWEKPRGETLESIPFLSARAPVTAEGSAMQAAAPPAPVPVCHTPSQA